MPQDIDINQSVLNRIEDGAQQAKQRISNAVSATSEKVTGSSQSEKPASSSASSSSTSSNNNNTKDELSPSTPSFLSGFRQSKLDAQIQSKIRAELSKLRSQEAEVRAAIDAALEKENAAREQKAVEAGEGGVKGRSGVLLRKELEELRTRLGAVAERSKREIPGQKDIQKAREQVVACYKAHPDRSLDCWAEAQAFKEAVARAERAFVSSHSAAPSSKA
ncbi:hypothetical protein OC846_002180 [Tilletia horrida]|uniref:MICOS complex subunit mic19 n=1 Tax=Tilletia horrida TaxID=155126 RepID=A0AAN6GXL3_9BASI|nr:hypothetical protein OC845_004248 [Tilletia horrida]KAK0554297.1 hypothetical protein OC846_002180 [Tilletia horrida]KAK0563388.1 hypothetical protein OC861_004837 [Tilletia horrida]